MLSLRKTREEANEITKVCCPQPVDSTHLAEVETCFLNTRLSKCVIFLNVVKNFAKTPITIRFSIVELVAWWCGLVQPVRLLRAKVRQKDCGGERRVVLRCQCLIRSPDAINKNKMFSLNLTWHEWDDKVIHTLHVRCSRISYGSYVEDSFDGPEITDDLRFIISWKFWWRIRSDSERKKDVALTFGNRRFCLGEIQVLRCAARRF